MSQDYVLDIFASKTIYVIILVEEFSILEKKYKQVNLPGAQSSWGLS